MPDTPFVRDGYIGRFAPSPSGLLHAGSLIAAMASYLDAKAHQGLWLVRIEDIDEARTVAGAADAILHTLQIFGMHWDGEVVVQSQRQDHYAAAFARLSGHSYPCGCSRREIADSRLGIGADGAAIYPGTCRHGLAADKPVRSMRLRVPDATDDNIGFDDRWRGHTEQSLATEVGDFVLKRADGFWAYQLAVVVDDGEQGITDIVRGADLLESTPRQIYLQHLLGLPTPRYLHVPVLTNHAGEKLSKQTGAAMLDLMQPQRELLQAAQFLGLPLTSVASLDAFWSQAVALWRNKYLS